MNNASVKHRDHLGVENSGREKGEGKGSWIWLKYFILMYENRILTH
jgi:hypothetical protein